MIRQLNDGPGAWVVGGGGRVPADEEGTPSVAATWGRIWDSPSSTVEDSCGWNARGPIGLNQQIDLPSDCGPLQCPPLEVF